MSVNFEVITVIAITLLCLVISVVALMSAKKSREKLMQCVGLINDLHKAIELSKAKNHGHEMQLSEIKKQVARWQSAAEKYQQRLVQCEDNIDRLFEQDPALKLYSKASKLVSQGESIDDVIEASGLPRAEVEVLFSLYKK